MFSVRIKGEGEIKGGTVFFWFFVGRFLFQAGILPF
jgi:hypothetical protein